MKNKVKTVEDEVLRLIISYAEYCCLCVVKCVLGGQIYPNPRSWQDGDVTIRLPE